MGQVVSSLNENLWISSAHVSDKIIFHSLELLQTVSLGTYGMHSYVQLADNQTTANK